MEIEDASTASRKGKQASPQNIVRRLGVPKKRLKYVKTNGHQNVLQEEALELGLLNSTETQFSGDNDDLSVTPTSLVSRPSTHDDGHDVTSRFSGDVAAVLLLSHGILLLPDLPDTSNKFCQITFGTNKKASKKSSKDVLLNSPHNVALSRIPINFTQLARKTQMFKNQLKVSTRNLKGFLEEVGELELTGVGQQVGTSPS